jgi:hypothetical protein
VSHHDVPFLPMNGQATPDRRQFGRLLRRPVKCPAMRANMIG